MLSARTSLRGLLCRPASVDRTSRQAAALDAAACSANGDAAVEDAAQGG